MAKYHINKDFIKKPLSFYDIHLVQIGRLHCAPKDYLRMHAHKNWYELTIVTDGEGEISVNGCAVRVKRGDIHLSLPCDTHGIRSFESAPLKYDFFSFFTSNPEYSERLSEITKFLPPESRIFKDERINSLVCDAILEFIEHSEFSEELLYSIFKHIIILMIRDIDGKSEPRLLITSKKDELCYQIMNYIDTHIYTRLCLEEIGKELTYNYSYLSAVFKKTTGYTIASYYRKKRLELARLLLSDKNYTATEIADMLGYSSLYAFSRAFKELYGVSPRGFINKNTDL